MLLPDEEDEHLHQWRLTQSGSQQVLVDRKERALQEVADLPLRHVALLSHQNFLRLLPPSGKKSLKYGSQRAAQRGS